MGVLYAREAGAWVPITPVVVSPVIPSLFVIPDAVGNSYPALRFDTGDGGNGVGPNPYHYEFNLYNDRLRLYSNRQPSVPLAEFAKPAADQAEFKLADYVFKRGADGYLRIYTGGGASNFAFDGSGNTWHGNVSASGTLTCGAITSNAQSSFQNLVVNNTILGAAGVLVLSSNGVSYTNIAGAGGGGQALAGHQYGVGDYGKLCCVSNSANNSWQYRPFTITCTGSAAAGFSYYQAANGWVASMQMHFAGLYYIGTLNGDNSGYIASYASAFTVNSGRRFKGDVERLGSMREAIKRVSPVHYRDLQEDMARDTLYFPPDDYVYPEGVAPVVRNEEAIRAVRETPPLYRYGLIAEEVAEALPDLVMPSHLGPGIDLSGLIAVLWRQVQDLTDQVEALQSAAP